MFYFSARFRSIGQQIDSFLAQTDCSRASETRSGISIYYLFIVLGHQPVMVHMGILLGVIPSLTIATAESKTALGLLFIPSRLIEGGAAFSLQ